MGKNYLCPVCGYTELTSDPKTQDYNICACCMTEFGVDDCKWDASINAEMELDEAYKLLRDNWVSNGMKWFSSYTKPPKSWNPTEQLRLLFNQPTERQ